jgi:2,3-diaminopropionate biosynthesis protein SbnA
VAVISVPQDFNVEQLYVDLRSIFGRSLFLKCEGLNLAGSVKLKAATEMVEAAERSGLLRPGSILVESSSGNLGMALSMLAASKGYRFVCVTDSRCNLSARLTMEALGAQVHIVTEPAAEGGLLGARINYVRELCAADDRYVWLNQYLNPNNQRAHYRRTAPAIAREFPALDVLFVGAGTTGTLMGCARYFREWHRRVRVVAVDSVGSVSFGGLPGRRMIPGLGTSVRPPLLDESYIDEVIHVEEAETIRACHRMARRGFLFGGSTGTVVSGAMRWLAEHDGRDVTAVALAPDFGERYLDTIYQPNWVAELYGAQVLSPEPPTVRSRSDPAVFAEREDGKPRNRAIGVEETTTVLTDVEILPAGPARAPSPDPKPGPGGGSESGLAEVLAGVLGVDRVPVESHFFDDLDADSMVMAQFCARVRKRHDLPAVSMKDIYRHPTIGGLASALGQPAPVTRFTSADSPVPAPIAVTPTGSTARYILCGALQALIGLGFAYLATIVLYRGFEWLGEPADVLGIYLRSVVFGSATLFAVCLLPILGKWILIGRWKPQRIQVWTLGYVRFWLAKSLMRANPLVLFAGSPIYSVYLRMMGAKIGRGVVVHSPSTVCTDLLTIGEGSVIRKDAQMPGYRVLAGVIEIGPVTLGKDVIVGEQTVIDIDTSMGDRTRLGHCSSLHAGQHISDGEHWQGSPARRTDVDPQTVAPARCGNLRRVLYSLWQLVIPLGVYAPLGLSGVVLIAKIPQLAPLLDAGPPVLTSWTYYRDVALVSLVLYFGLMAANFGFIMTIPRLLNLAIKPGRVYRLYGFHYWVQRTIARHTNSQFFMALFGDSSYVVHYLRWLGYDLGRYEQTGSNFGSVVKHDNPYLSSVGAGTMIADGLSMINLDYSSTSFQLSRVSVGAHSFLGNNIAYPSQARVGENCLLATKVMVPLDGPVREGVGLLGAPSFEIPRTVERDNRLELADQDRQRQLRAKTRHNTVTIAMFLMSRWFLVFMVTLLGATADLCASLGVSALVLSSVTSTLISVGYLILLQRAVTRLQALRPRGCSIYDRAFWRHERYWKVPDQNWMQAFNGTPFKNLIWRAMGVRIGRRVFDDGFFAAEKSLVIIGDDCTLNAGTIIQCHSQEDGAFKSDRTAIGDGVTLGVGAFVHYGVTIGEGVTLAPDTFVMKGEDIPPHTRWSGNPAASGPELIADNLAPSTGAVVELPKLGQLVAVSDTDNGRARTRRSPAHHMRSRPHAAGLVLTAMVTAAAFLTVSNTVPPESATPSPTCTSPTADCQANAAPEIVSPGPTTAPTATKAAPDSKAGRSGTTTAVRAARTGTSAPAHYVSGGVPSGSTPPAGHAKKQDSKAKAKKKAKKAKRKN